MQIQQHKIALANIIDTASLRAEILTSAHVPVVCASGRHVPHVSESKYTENPKGIQFVRRGLSALVRAFYCDKKYEISDRIELYEVFYFQNDFVLLQLNK